MQSMTIFDKLLGVPTAMHLSCRCAEITKKCQVNGRHLGGGGVGKGGAIAPPNTLEHNGFVLKQQMGNVTSSY